jgi:hypothetical protein
VKVFLTGLAVIAALAGVTACNEPAAKTYVTKKEGAVNTALCLGDTPYIMRVRKGTAGETIVCVTEQTFNKYNVGNEYTG